ncbi:BtpA/SgcQ family protein, partial [Thermus sp.]|uniref:BtpA/SgcQ family protein n=1 Tax=Thermus sp. TaxID=275 RepID=UPI0026110D79
MTAEWKRHWDSVRISSLKDLFGVEKPVIGMVHLPPLPGAPGYTGYGIGAVIEAALADARALARGGVDGIIVENMWDLPYFVGRAVPPEESAAQAVAARAVVEEVSVPVGINV